MEEGGIFHDSDSVPSLPSSFAGGVAGQKARRGRLLKGASVSVGPSQKKILTDITNMDQQQQAMQHLAPIAAPANDISAELLLKENAMLMKLLANRNATIESYKAQLEKCQSNFQILRKQNSELILTNGQMMAELSSSRQRIRELQHELGGKNGILKALKLELMAKEHTAKLKHVIDANEVGGSQIQADQAFQEKNRGETKRKRVTKSQCTSAPIGIKQVKSTEKADNRRYSSRRQSAGLKVEEPGPAEDNFFAVDEIKFNGSCKQASIANENESTSLGSKVHEEAREDAECESSGPTNTEQVHAKRNVEKKRSSLRRQSARFIPEKPKPTEDLFDIDDEKFAVSNLCDDMLEKSLPTTSSETSSQKNIACTSDPREIRRSSVGRPMRKSAEKVVSYKEIPLNIKMRRPQS